MGRPKKEKLETTAQDEGVVVEGSTALEPFTPFTPQPTEEVMAEVAELSPMPIEKEAEVTETYVGTTAVKVVEVVKEVLVPVTLTAEQKQSLNDLCDTLEDLYARSNNVSFRQKVKSALTNLASLR